MFTIRWQQYLLSAVVGFTMLVSAACGTVSTQGTASGQGTPSNASSPTPVPSTATPIVVATPLPLCSNIFPGSTSVGTLSGFADIPFPGGTVKANMQSPAVGPGSFQIVQYDICFHGQVSDVNGPFSAHQSIFAQLLAVGWGQGNPSAFPYDGQFLGACHPQPDICLTTSLNATHTSNNTERLATMEHITDHGNSTITFHLRLAYPPAAPACNANFTNSPVQGIQTTASTSYGTMPLPPVSYIAPDNAPGHGGADICSAGTAATLATFLTTYMPQFGWSLHSSGSSFQIWKSSTGCITLSIAPPVFWGVSWPNPSLGVPFNDCS